MDKIEVGKKFAPFYHQPEGAYFIVDDSGIMLVYNYRMPTEKELDAVKEDKPAEFRFAMINNAFFFLSKFGSLPWNDSPFNPLLSRETGLQPPTDPDKGYAMLFMMIDAATNIVKHMRVIGLGHDFSVKLCDALNSFYDREENKELEGWDAVRRLNDERVNAVYNLYTSDQLARRADASFKLHPEG